MQSASSYKKIKGLRLANNVAVGLDEFKQATQYINHSLKITTAQRCMSMGGSIIVNTTAMQVCSYILTV